MLAERISRRRLIAGSSSGRGIVLLWRGASARECCRDRGLRGCHWRFRSGTAL